MLLYEAIHWSKCAFTWSTSNWQKTGLTEWNTDFLSRTLVSLYFWLPYNKGNIFTTKTREFPLYGVHSLLVHLWGFPYFIPVRVNNLDGKKEGKHFRRISFHKWPFCTCFSGHHVACIHQHAHRVPRLMRTVFSAQNYFIPFFIARLNHTPCPLTCGVF